MYAHLDPIDLTFSYQDYLLLSKVILGLAPPSNTDTDANTTSPSPVSSSSAPDGISFQGSTRTTSDQTTYGSDTETETETDVQTSDTHKDGVVLGGTLTAGAAGAGADI